MRRAVAVGLMFIAANALAASRLVSADDRWIQAINDAEKELAACRKLGVEAKLYGDVTVSYDRKHHRWTRSSSRSLDAVGVKAAACVQDAIARHFRDDPSDESWDSTLSETQTIGTPVVVLPALARLLPVWRRARTDGRRAASWRSCCRRIIGVSADGCFRTDRDAIANVEYLWLPTVGPWVPRLWDKTLASVLGDHVELAMWHAPGELVTKSARGLCLVPFDAAKQTALRAQMDKVASCLAGGFEDVLLHPHVALPAGSYAQVSTQNGRVCALSTAGEITCCGPPDPALPPPPKGPFTQVVAGGTFGCALDAKGAATCWGAIGAPPPGPFTKLSAEYHARVRRADAAASSRAGAPATTTSRSRRPARSATSRRRSSARAACTPTAASSAGASRAAARIRRHVRARRRRVDARVRPAPRRHARLLARQPGRHAAARRVHAGRRRRCVPGLHARRRTARIACTPAQSTDAVTPPPAGTFTQLTGDHQMFCAVATDHHVACWGEPWPGAGPATTRGPTRRCSASSRRRRRHPRPCPRSPG